MSKTNKVQRLEGLILRHVMENPGCTGIDIICAVTDDNVMDMVRDIPGVLDGFVNDGEMVEVGYITPGSNREKVRYFPAGTEILIRGANGNVRLPLV